jgi:preprotein translocase subunit YajC
MQILVVLFSFLSIGYADDPFAFLAAPNPAGGPPLPNPLLNLVPFVLMIGVVYFLMIRPQQKKFKETQLLLSNLKAGDEIITAAGIIGKIADLADKIVVIEVAQNVRFRCLKSKIVGLYKSNTVLE